MVWLDAKGGPRLAWWNHDGSKVTLVGAWFAVGDVRPGEDGTPCIRVHEEAGEGMIAVFDGLGGAGTRAAWQLAEHEKPLSSACVASNVTSAATLAWHTSGKRSALELKDEILAALREADAASNVPKPKFSGSALRQLPTTLAAINYTVVDRGQMILVRALWVGDSRCYVLDATSGLRQLSIDDTRGDPDALGSLRDGPPMTATIGLDRPFEIHERHHEVEPPALLIVVTDGCTDYLVAPHHLELRLLRTLAESDTPETWSRLIAEQVAGVAGDDATLIAAGYGYGGFEAMKAAFAERRAALDELDSMTIGRSDPADREAKDRAVDAAWASYRADYESLQGKASSG